MKTPKRTHARDMGEKLAAFWERTNYSQRERGDQEYALEWMLADAWLKGFEAGRRDEKQRSKEK